MGETQSVHQDTSFVSSLTLVESTNDKYFGPVDIYRTKEPPYEYLMDYKKTFIEDKTKMNNYIHYMNQIKNMDHKNLAKIHHCEMMEQIQVCIKQNKVHTFYSYFNFTLEGAIERKKLQDAYFPQNQLIYIMGSMLDVALYLKQYGISMGQYRSKSIYLSPEGYIKIYLIQLEEQNKHSSYYKALQDKSQISNHIFSPQQLYYLSQLQFSIKYDVYKADVFAIAMIILQLITLDKSKFYYNTEMNELKMDRISFDISSMAKKYTDRFVHLIKCCLQPQSNNRFSLEEAMKELDSIRKTMKSVTYCIRLFEDDQKIKKTTMKRQITISAKGQHILDGLQKRLAPSPISTLSSSTTNNFRIQAKSMSSRGSELTAHRF